MSYKFLEHISDVKFQATGLTIENMLMSSADALNEVIRGNTEIVKLNKKKFKIKGKDKEKLLYNFLEEFLFLLEAKSFLVAEVKIISVKKNKIVCVVLGDKAENYKFTNNVKAITYSDIFVRETNKGFVCQVILDV